MKNHFQVASLSISLLFILFGPAAASSELADVVLSGGEIYTGNEKVPWASAVAIRGDRLIYVGDDAGARAFVGPKTQHYHLDGKFVTPGLIDAHTHPGMVAISVGQVSLEPASTREELFANIADMLQKNPDRPVLMGGYWDNDLFDEKGPHKRDLDRIESKRPVILYDAWGHSTWANSKALEFAGVDRNTPDVVPSFSFYQRDANGDPTGWVTESAASNFVNHFQSVTPKVEQSILEFLIYLRNLGVTTLLDAGNFGLDEDVYAAISRLDKSGKLPVRYYGAYTLYLPDEYPTAIETLKRLGEKYNSDRVRINTLKVFLDGVIETRTADMSEDYLDTPGNSGSSLLNRKQLHKLILDLDREGFNMHVHAVGDKSVKTMLNAVQDAHASLSRPPRIRIAICHLEVVDERDFNRFKDLGVIASFTPQWHGGGGDEGLFSAIGDKANSMMRAQPMISDGAVVTFSSDITDEYGWKSESANPFYGMQTGHNKQDVEGGADAPLSPPQSERLRMDALLDGYTRNAAFQLGRGDELGVIQVGYLADLAVLDQNLFEANRYRIHATKPLAVIMNGKIVFGELSLKN
jgi:predicted amidohydrolase YtcJ